MSVPLPFILAACATLVCAGSFAALQTVGRGPLNDAVAPLLAIDTQAIAVPVMLSGKRTYLAVRLRHPPALVASSVAPFEVRVQDALIDFIERVAGPDKAALLGQQTLLEAHLQRRLGDDGVEVLEMFVSRGSGG